MTESPEESVASDLPTVAEDHEATILMLQARMGKMKSLLLKAKASIGEQRHKAEELEERLETERELNEILRNKVEKLENRACPLPHEIISVLGRVKIDGEVWAMIRTVRATAEWFKESELTLEKDALLPEILDSACAHSIVNSQIENIVKQYEDRMLRMQSAVEQYEDSLRDVQKAYKCLQEAFKEREKELQSNDELLTVISESRNIHDRVISVVLEDGINVESFAPLQDIVATYLQFEGKESQRVLKEHIASLHRTILDFARRLLHSRKEQQAQETAWRATCDSLVNEKEELKGSLNRVRSDFARKVEENERKVASLTLTYSQEILEKNQQITALQTDLKNAVNTPYLRKVVVQFLLSSDPVVHSTQMQDGLIHVLATILEFSREDLVTIHRQRTPKGVLTRWLGA